MHTTLRDTGRRGFSLIELMLVVVIIGVLAALAIPKYSNTKQKAVRTTAITDLRNLATAQNVYFSENNVYGGVADTAAMRFSPSKGNTGLSITLAGAPAGTTGWNATLDIAGGQKCGIFVGAATRPVGMPAGTFDATPTCW